MQRLKDQAMEAAGDAGNAEQLYTQCLRELWEAETKQLVSLVAQFFGKQWPQSQEDWLELIFLICAGFDAPGFQSGLPGAPKKRGKLQNMRLFADVMSITTKGKLKAYDAVRHITKNPEQFLNRYSEYEGETKTKTLYDQFLDAKKAFDRTEHTDRLYGNPLGREAAIKREIDLHSAQADRRHKHQITEKSGKPKNP